MTTAILLAAGSSSRMGAMNKLLLDINGEPMISHVLKQLLASDIDHVVAVTGHQQEEVELMLSNYSIDVIHNPQHEVGMVTSIKAGLTFLPQEASRFIIVLGDMPLLTSTHIDQLLTFASQQTNKNIIRPISNNKELGHPVIFDSRYIVEIMNCSDDHSLKSVVKANISSFVPYETEDRAYYTDMDTPQAYQQLNL